MMVNACGVPGHVTAPKVYLGVTVIVAVTGLVVALVAAKAAMLPVPVPARPIEGVSLTAVVGGCRSAEVDCSSHTPCCRQPGRKDPLHRA